MRAFLTALPILLAVACSMPPSSPEPAAAFPIQPRLTPAQVESFARLALEGIVREYPNKPGEVLGSAADVMPPRAMHPAFYGSFDWHSAVHGHWMLIRLLKLHPGSAFEAEARALLDAHLSADNLAAEAEYFTPRHNHAFERTYGWAWLLRTALELHDWDDPQGRAWARNLVPLEARILELTKEYLPRLSWPLRMGEHPNTAWALSEFLDYARTKGDAELEQLALERARSYYLEDRAYPVNYEPSGHDFFSPCLLEADLMRRVLDAEAYAAWLEAFLPRLTRGGLGNLAQPVVVSDPTDGKLVHLAGLNLVRAWCQRGIAGALPAQDPRRAILLDAAAAHQRAGLAYVGSGHYEGDHWLASFAVYLLTDTGLGAAR